MKLTSIQLIAVLLLFHSCINDGDEKGRSVQTYSPAEIDKYVRPATEVYARKFTGGLVLVNPSDKEYHLKLDEKLFDPETKLEISEFTIPPNTGKYC